ncbi:hypothetical protein Pyn_38822 [Prunus yedoensis var. nudiflora]|uniref:Uncharacterized protein n=1 Tax=Prunus yedoensis var. nudiflora TaxID=2094558 RepID=A0A315ABE7_PRUYE|nr:hypothetical protein Pyn_38822 [Prunus yedoensis var. nudiflora]
MRPKPPPFDFFSPIPHKPLHMGIIPQTPCSNFGVLAEETVLVTDFHHQKDIWVGWKKEKVLERRKLLKELLVEGEIGCGRYRVGLVGDEVRRKVVDGCLSTTKGNQGGGGEGLGAGGGWGGAGVLGSWGLGWRVVVGWVWVKSGCEMGFGVGA